MAQLVERKTLDLGVVSSRPMLGVEFTFKKKKKKELAIAIFSTIYKIKLNHSSQHFESFHKIPKFTFILLFLKIHSY